MRAESKLLPKKNPTGSRRSLARVLVHQGHAPAFPPDQNAEMEQICLEIVARYGDRKPVAVDVWREYFHVSQTALENATRAGLPQPPLLKLSLTHLQTWLAQRSRHYATAPLSSELARQEELVHEALFDADLAGQFNQTVETSVPVQPAGQQFLPQAGPPVPSELLQELEREKILRQTAEQKYKLLLNKQNNTKRQRRSKREGSSSGDSESAEEVSLSESSNKEIKGNTFNKCRYCNCLLKGAILRGDHYASPGGPKFGVCKARPATVEPERPQERRELRVIDEGEGQYGCSKCLHKYDAVFETGDGAQYKHAQIPVTADSGDSEWIRTQRAAGKAQARFCPFFDPLDEYVGFINRRVARQRARDQVRRQKKKEAGQ
jgi:hypothetical protein